MIQARSRDSLNKRSKNKPFTANPLQNGIRTFLQKSNLIVPESIPKRYTLYAPFLLLPVNFVSQKGEWLDTYDPLNINEKAELFHCIADAFTETGQPVTHIAINAPISPGNACDEATPSENVLRSPSNLVPVYGDFGPTTLLDTDAANPTRKDFEAAFWASTQQGRNASQVWAPRWTMFSRGNITEKTRILDVGSNANPFTGLTKEELDAPLNEIDVLDLYVGIGYFAFSYLARGVRRVWGWDLNPWSIEGLRKGCEANGWCCLVVEVGDNGELQNISVEELARLVSTSGQDGDSGQIQCVAFRGNNKWATRVMSSIADHLKRSSRNSSALHIRHVNLGLLPSSHAGWEAGARLVDGGHGGWLHVHENVGMQQIEAKSHAVVEPLRGMLKAADRHRWQVECKHIAPVKTYAPGVMHCVFDISVRPAADEVVSSLAF